MIIDDKFEIIDFLIFRYGWTIEKILVMDARDVWILLRAIVRGE